MTALPGDRQAMVATNEVRSGLHGAYRQGLDRAASVAGDEGVFNFLGSLEAIAIRVRRPVEVSVDQKRAFEAQRKEDLDSWDAGWLKAQRTLRQCKQVPGVGALAQSFKACEKAHGAVAARGFLAFFEALVAGA